MQSGEGVKGSVERRRRREVRQERTAVERGELFVCSSSESRRKRGKSQLSTTEEWEEGQRGRTHLVRYIPSSEDPFTTRVLLQIVEQEVGTSSRRRLRVECLSALVDLVEHCILVSVSLSPPSNEANETDRLEEKQDRESEERGGLSGRSRRVRWLAEWLW